MPRFCSGSSRHGIGSRLDSRTSRIPGRVERRVAPGLSACHSVSVEAPPPRILSRGTALPREPEKGPEDANVNKTSSISPSDSKFAVDVPSVTDADISRCIADVKPILGDPNLQSPSSTASPTSKTTLCDVHASIAYSKTADCVTSTSCDDPHSTSGQGSSAEVTLSPSSDMALAHLHLLQHCLVHLGDVAR
ncbi:unnamed protein product [Protopolystoma xenopodis]|uniref:Uncharacterized protein n=1 Tax=Protopolystoma xenopodis TaxID=117903 RepID=A0A3S5ABW5_9PLAT|nr:unnamed protein product [Protopolystoma xenopodis]